MRSIKDMKIGEEATIKEFLDSAGICKLMTLGAMPHTKVKLLRKSPFGNAYLLKINDQYVALRSSEAEGILLENAN